MPALYQQLPGELDIVAAHGDGITLTGNTGFSLVGDTLTAVVFENTSAGYAAAIATPPAPAATWSVTVVNAAAGDVSLSLSASTVKALSPGTDYRWFIRSASLNRAITSGMFSLRVP